MNQDEFDKKRDEIVRKHGCELLPAAYGGPTLQVIRVNQQGFPRDKQRIDACIAELREAKVYTRNLLVG